MGSSRSVAEVRDGRLGAGRGPHVDAVHLVHRPEDAELRTITGICAVRRSPVV
jgi:hypothetical protein